MPQGKNSLNYLYHCYYLYTVSSAFFGTRSVFPFNLMLNRHHDNAIGSFNFQKKILKLLKTLDQIARYLSSILQIFFFMENSSNHRVTSFGTTDFSHLSSNRDRTVFIKNYGNKLSLFITT